MSSSQRAKAARQPRARSSGKPGPKPTAAPTSNRPDAKREPASSSAVNDQKRTPNRVMGRESILIAGVEWQEHSVDDQAREELAKRVVEILLGHAQTNEDLEG
jgi:hypothetical protein